jgi:hypothetical protein
MEDVRWHMEDGGIKLFIFVARIFNGGENVS